jgi:hypothetical protein
LARYLTKIPFPLRGAEKIGGGQKSIETNCKRGIIK